MTRSVFNFPSKFSNNRKASFLYSIIILLFNPSGDLNIVSPNCIFLRIVDTETPAISATSLMSRVGLLCATLSLYSQLSSSDIEIVSISLSSSSVYSYTSTSKESIKNIEGSKNSVIQSVSKEVKVYDEETVLSKTTEDLDFEISKFLFFN